MAPRDTPATQARDLIQPLGSTLCETRSLDSADRLLREVGLDYVVITNLSDHAIGIITERDIAELQLARPEKWASRRCACAVHPHPTLQADVTMAEVVELFSHTEIRPLLVLEGREALGVLRPTEVFQWCAQYWPAALDQLARHARHENLQPSHG
ncbi:CBS domain-containing protein [Nesterenkonia sp. Act20]|uniref:CBS domain-containing protein n=1 Tax=Nesterenkonia sp. Act20 TaxID=1483432 RepID=UPI001C459577|nr:CBS domain-containing protein [Nesterenkonia sp. Act20]